MVVYLLTGSAGQYEVHDWIVRAFTSKAKAEAVRELAQQRADEIDALWGDGKELYWDFEWAPPIDPKYISEHDPEHVADTDKAFYQVAEIELDEDVV